MQNVLVNFELVKPKSRIQYVSQHRCQGQVIMVEKSLTLIQKILFDQIEFVQLQNGLTLTLTLFWVI